MYIGEWIKGWQLVYCFQTTLRTVSIDILCIGTFIVGVIFIGIIFIRIFLIGIVFIGSFSIYRNSIIGFDL
ncbi:hypothetical protein N7541_001111 [Penicillium brevicompactum]|uniref:Uncharacterized protein n=1 Tax=Penicillium brevicompactum TaxID=5074 RepID=A0A9W9RWY2_PENBR|nr:hypothetical protein N7541_001111 [Penicillium brevicompactum]